MDSTVANFATVQIEGGRMVERYIEYYNNDINEDTRTQLELINQTLAQLQSENKEKNTPRKKIGFY